jgi:hypothetical protein
MFLLLNFLLFFQKLQISTEKPLSQIMKGDKVETGAFQTLSTVSMNQEDFYKKGKFWDYKVVDDKG